MDEKDLQDLKPFAPKPYWNPDAKIELSGLEFERLFNLLQPFLEGGFIVQGILDRHLKDGTIKVKYEYTDGSGELSEEEVKQYTEWFLEQMKAQQAPQPAPEPAIETSDNVKPLNKKSKIITNV